MLFLLHYVTYYYLFWGIQINIHHNCIDWLLMRLLRQHILLLCDGLLLYRC